MKSLRIFALVLIGGGFSPVGAQIVQPDAFRPQRFWIGNTVLVGADAAVMIGLSQLWYSDYERSRFHFHDDLDNWKQQDKIGHLITSWHVARVFGQYGRWSGLTDYRAGLYGGLVSVIFETQIEVLDGFSERWGFSWSDMAFNVVGAALGAAQVADDRFAAVILKYSYHRSSLYDDELSFTGNAIKDYEGITYWLVVRPARLPGDPLPWWPRWLGVSLGHGAEGLERALPTPEQPHERQLFLALDLDVLAAVNWPRPWMRTVASVLSFIRIPAPALQLSPDVKLHPVFY